jgi:hypothetical protein
MSKSAHVKTVESWTIRKGVPAPVQRTKIAVRVKAGSTGPQGQRPGTFQGATNFSQR